MLWLWHLTPPRLPEEVWLEPLECSSWDAHLHEVWQEDLVVNCVKSSRQIQQDEYWGFGGCSRQSQSFRHSREYKWQVLIAAISLWFAHRTAKSVLIALVMSSRTCQDKHREEGKPMMHPEPWQKEVNWEESFRDANYVDFGLNNSHCMNICTEGHVINLN